MRFWLYILVLTSLDQIAKWVVQISISPGDFIPLVPGVLWLTHTKNTGAAFSVLSGYSGFLIAMSLTVIVVAIYVRRRLFAMGLEAGLTLVLSGAIGNLVDRIRLGYVVDFLELRFWPVFNLADVYITLGACLIIFFMFRVGHNEGR